MKKKTNCIFFGKKNCKFSKNAIQFLKKKFYVTAILTQNIIGEKINFSKLKQVDYLFTYTTKIIVPKKILEKIKIGSFNFHNTLPKYPGSGGNALSILNNDKYCGITIHHLNDLVDNGKIIFIKRYKIKKNSNIEDLLTFVKKKQLIVFKFFINRIMSYNWISKKEKKHSSINWSNRTFKMKEINQLRKTNLNMKKKDIEKRIRAFSIEKYKPYIILKKRKFILEKN